MVRLQLSVAVLCICFFVVSTNRYFVLQNEGDNGQSEGESGQTPPINSAYFQCDQQTTCTHVVKFKETDKFGIIFGHDQLAKIKEKVSVWKKKDGKDIQLSLKLFTPIQTSEYFASSI